jgi:hypothetical protein
MADKDKSLMLALGVDPETGEYKKGPAGENLIGDLKEETKQTIGEEFDQFKQEPDISQQKGDAKLPRLAELKQASQMSGGNLNSEAGLSLMRSIESNVIVAAQKVQKSIMSTFLPVEVELKRTIELLSSPNEMAQDEALDRMESLQKVMKIDFEKISQAMGVNVQDLLKARQFQREENRKKDELQDRIVQERIEVRNELRERGINTVLDKKTNTLKVLSLNEEKLVKKEIFKTEKELIKKIKENEKLVRELRRGDTVDPKKNLEIQRIKNEENKAIADLNKRKEEANIKPEEDFKGQGFFSNTYGAAFDQAKATFDELKFGVKSVIGGFKKLSGGLSGFGSSLSGAKDKIGGFFKSLLKGKDGETPTAGGMKSALAKAGLALGGTGGAAAAGGAAAGGATAAGGAAAGSGLLAAAAAPVLIGGAVVAGGAYGLKKLKDKKEREGTLGGSFDESSGEYIPGGEELNPTFDFKTGKPKITPIDKNMNVNKMSSDLAAQKSSPTVTNIVAPSNSSIVSNNDQSQTMALLSYNPDRSFINLNAIKY